MSCQTAERSVRATGFLGLVLVLLGGCDSTVGPFDPDDPLIRTEEQGYELELQGDEWLSTEIPYTFENRTGRTVHIPNCQGGISLRLDRLEGLDWESTWIPNLLLCISPPIVVDPGESFFDTLHVSGGLPGTRTGPRWDREDPSGIYRIVWMGAFAGPGDPSGSLGPQLPLEHRVSNPFALSR
ncbi:MAG: hypothetical protein ACLFWG_03465 [Longimicrobiales bacterium]